MPGYVLAPRLFSSEGVLLCFCSLTASSVRPEPRVLPHREETRHHPPVRLRLLLEGTRWKLLHHPPVLQGEWLCDHVSRKSLSPRYCLLFSICVLFLFPAQVQGSPPGLGAVFAEASGDWVNTFSLTAAFYNIMLLDLASCSHSPRCCSVPSAPGA